MLAATFLFITFFYRGSLLSVLKGDITLLHRNSLLFVQRGGLRDVHATPYIFAPVLLVQIISLLHASQDYASAKKTAESDPYRFYVQELGGYLPTDWREYIMQARASKETPALEEYWGLWSAITRRHNSPPVDSIIHALGSKRTIFANAVKALPNMVITTRLSTSPDWQPWNLSANYWFYQPLLENYEPSIASPTTLFWRKKNTLSDMPVVPCKANRKNNGFTLTTATPGYYEVKPLFFLFSLHRCYLSRSFLSCMPHKTTHRRKKPQNPTHIDSMYKSWEGIYPLTGVNISCRLARRRKLPR